ncbi:MAG: ABC transporter ATP-binding protein [Lachnospiraceae bacterium]|nr:ABC transporter ATP-binding protein [Lachnospiraceae bacterium]
MRISEYLHHTGRSGSLFLYLILPVGLGLLPAISIRLRADLIDAAALGTAGGGYGFWGLLFGYVLLFLFQSVMEAAQLCLTERRGIRQGAVFDTMRLEKALRVSFPVTEDGRYHSLRAKAAQAPELDRKIMTSLGDMARTGVSLLTSLTVLWMVDEVTAAGLMILLAVGLFYNRRLAQRTEGFWERYMDNMRRTNYFSDLLLHREYAAERKLFAYHDEINRRYRAAFLEAKKENAGLGLSRFRVEASMQLIFALYSVAMVLLLMRPLLAGTITTGMFTSAFYAAIGLERNGSQIYASVYGLSQSLKQMKSFFEFMELEETEDVSSPEADEEPFHLESIVFSHVSFTYPGAARPVLHDVSFRLEPGRHYALVGENGCGKSTLVKLMAGLYSPDSGEVSVNGRPVQSYMPSRRKRIFAVVFQDFYRFPLTVRENVSLCLRDTADEERIYRVFEKLDFHPAVLSRETGLDSSLMLLQKEGAGLSGGEWQKLAIARCVLADAPAAVLDEPNAALDPAVEASIYRAYREMLSGKTTLFISHRLGSVRMADEILVLKDGGLLAMASHRELMRDCSYYNRLFETQRRLYDER